MSFVVYIHKTKEIQHVFLEQTNWENGKIVQKFTFFIKYIEISKLNRIFSKTLKVFSKYA